MLNIEQYEIAFAALFHDIGKFKQRAYGGDENNLSKETRKMEAMLLPRTKDGRYSHRHALWTYSFFIDDISPRFKGNHFLELINIEKIAKYAAEHHNPTDSISRIIETADKLSAANDRLAEDEKYEKGSYLVKPLRAIFSLLNLENKNPLMKSEYSYCLEPLASKTAMFPQKDKEVSTAEYRKLFDDFLDCLYCALKDIHSYEHLLLKLKDILYEYTWCIPSATNDYYNDISLYDHSITTMSIALALANNEDGDKRIRICSFCVSGIQSFIFQSKYGSFPNAAKIFRGRSFVVSAFTTCVKNVICNKLGIIPFVDVIDAGGKMILILPSNTDIEVLEKFQEEVETFLLNKYFGTLSISIDFSMVVNPDELGKGNFLGLYKEIGRKLSVQKNHKFQSALKARNDFTFESYGLEKKVCMACGKHSCADDADICTVCEEEVLLGSRITKKQFISFSSKGGQCEIIPNMFISISDNTRVPFDNDCYIYSLSDGDETYPIWRLNNYVPLDLNKDFNSIANKAISDDNRGKPFLGYIKLDVDSLSELITTGIKVSDYSISRFSTISRSLHYFFNIYVYRLLEEEYPYTYTVLSGGDDVFLIMPWNQALQLVERLKEDFSSFCCNNPNLHFSVGVVVAGAKEPFAFVNSKANKALDIEAKEFNGKNAISYFGVTFSLNRLQAFIKDCNELSGYIRINSDESKPITMGMLYRIYQYVSDSLSEDNTSYGLARKYGVYSKIHYDIARNLKPRNEKDREIYAKAARFIMDKFNNYSDEDDLKKFKVMLIHTIYNFRITTIEMED